MRFLSSSALASAEKLRLAASCSAAETMSGSGLGHPQGPHVVRPDLEFHGPAAAAGPSARALLQAAVSSALGARISIEPPAFSTASLADCEAPATANATVALSSPSPKRRTPSRARRR